MEPGLIVLIVSISVICSILVIDLSTKRSSAAPPNLTANIFGPLKPERIDRHGEISSTMARSPPPPFTATTQRKYHMQHNRFHRRASLSSDKSINNNLKLKR
ncbi:hypothetical protein Bca101_078261 [Brassica carinata]